MANARSPRPGGTGNPKPSSGPGSTSSRKPGTSTAATRRPSRNAPPPPETGGAGPLLLIGGILLLFAIALVAILVLPGLGNSNNPGSTASGDISIGPDPTAKVDTFPNQGQDHIAVGQSHPPYNSDPPTSGPHYSNPDLWGVYDKPRADEALVHNLEHGGIVIHYDCATSCTEVINQLSNYARRYRPDVFTGILLAPRKLPEGAKISLTAWQHRLLLKSLDTEKINSFIATYFNKAPESAG